MIHLSVYYNYYYDIINKNISFQKHVIHSYLLNIHCFKKEY
jgi:hypothetical protein